MSNFINSLFKNKIDKEVNKKIQEIIDEKETKINRLRRENKAVRRERDKYHELYLDRVDKVKCLNVKIRNLERENAIIRNENIELIRKLNKKSQK